VDDGVNWDINNMEDFQHDDHTSMGLDALEQVRQVRHYLRLEEYDMPRLQRIPTHITICIYRVPASVPAAQRVSDSSLQIHGLLG
jgi:hypothetical protein